MATLTVRPTTMLYRAQVAANSTSSSKKTTQASTLCNALIDGNASGYGNVNASTTNKYYTGILGGFDFSNLPANVRIDSITVSLKAQVASKIGGIYCELIKNASSISSYTDLGDGAVYFGQNTSFSLKYYTVSAPNAASAVDAAFLRGGNLQVRFYVDCNASTSIYFYDLYVTVTYSEITNVTATFKNYDGAVLQTVTVESGSVPSYTGATPTKEQSAQYTYLFSGWSPSIGAITADTVYTAQYTQTLRKYTVNWYNEDGTLLETDSTEYGMTPTYDGANPTKPSTAQYSYTFKGWHTEIVTVTGNIDYYARYTETTNKYTVLWKNYDGTVLETDLTEYGKIPTYDGPTPIRPSTTQYTYAFFGWDTVIEEVTEDIIYTATYTQAVNRYAISADATEGGSVVGGGSYEYGSVVTLTAIAYSGYKFVEWSDGVTTPIRETAALRDVTYLAIFEPVYVMYDSIFCYQKWKHNGITANKGYITNVTNSGFTLTSEEDVSEGTASSCYFQVENGKSYKVDIDIDGDNWDIYFFFCNKDGVWSEYFSDSENRFSSNGSGNSSRVFTIPDDTDIVKAQIRCDANGSSNTVSFNNFKVYPAECSYMESTLSSEDSCNAVSWDIPVPVRDGYTFVGWNTDVGGNGVMYSSESDYPLYDLVLYSQWKALSKIYIGTKKITAVYCGTKKVSVYCGTQKLI